MNCTVCEFFHCSKPERCSDGDGWFVEHGCRRKDPDDKWWASLLIDYYFFDKKPTQCDIKREFDGYFGCDKGKRIK